MRASCIDLVDFICRRYQRAAEIGVGPFPDVAVALQEKGVRVLATDVKPFSHGRLKVVLDDVTEPDRDLYGGVEVLYALRPPPELVPHMKNLAQVLGVDLLIKPLASEHPGGRAVGRGSRVFFLWSCNHEKEGEDAWTRG